MSPSFSTPGDRPQRRFVLLPEQGAQESGGRPAIRRYRLASIARDDTKAETGPNKRGARGG